MQRRVTQFQGAGASPSWKWDTWCELAIRAQVVADGARGNSFAMLLNGWLRRPWLSGLPGSRPRLSACARGVFAHAVGEDSNAVVLLPSDCIHADGADHRTSRSRAGQWRRGKPES